MEQNRGFAPTPDVAAILHNLLDQYERRQDPQARVIRCDLEGLDRLLSHAHTLLRPGGRLLFDSLDVRCTDTPVHLAYQEANRRAGRYVGQIRMQFAYRSRMGPPFDWLHVDPYTLAEHAGRLGWSCRVVRQEENGDYLAQLTPVVGA